MTLQPHIILRNVPMGMSPWNLGLMVSYDWTVGHGWHLLSQLTGGWQADGSGPPVLPECRLGVRNQVTPTLSFDAHAGIDPISIGANYTAPYNQLIGLVGQYSY